MNPTDKAAQLGRKLFELKKQEAELKADLAIVAQEIKQLTEFDLAKLMVDSELQRFSLTGLGTLHLEHVFYANVLEENRGKFYQWLRDNGHGDLIRDYVFPGTVKAFAKELVSKNVALPDIVKVVVIPTVRIRNDAAT